MAKTIRTEEELRELWLTDNTDKVLGFHEVGRLALTGYVTMGEIESVRPDLWEKHKNFFKDMRRNYLADAKILVPPRITVYVFGGDKEYREKCCWNLGMTLVPYRVLENLFPIFVADKKTVPDEDYDGEPVIIWKNYTGRSLAKDYEDWLQLFDPYPFENIRTLANRIYRRHSITLHHKYGIVEGNEPPEMFLDNLYEDRKDGGDIKQAYRRFPILVHIVSEREFKVSVNQGVITKDRKLLCEYELYECSEYFPETVNAALNLCRYLQVNGAG